jgi:hypothetical protein
MLSSQRTTYGCAPGRAIPKQKLTVVHGSSRHWLTATTVREG